MVPFTGLSFKSFVDAYKSTYMRQHQEMTEKLQKTDAALEKVEEALQCVSEMKSELEEKEKVLAAETAKTDDALKVVGLIQLLFFVS